MKNLNSDVKFVICTIHGIESKGKNLKELSERLSKEVFIDYSYKFINIRYNRLLAIVNTLPWVRKMTAKYVASRLETVRWKFRNANIIVICHSNGTVAVSKAIKKSFNLKKPYPRIKVDRLVLLGSAVGMNFKWGNYTHIDVVNFISSNDLVIFFSRLYGMGRSGRYGFKRESENLTQFKVKWGHSGFNDHYWIIKREVFSDLS